MACLIFIYYLFYDFDIMRYSNTTPDYFYSKLFEFSAKDLLK